MSVVGVARATSTRSPRPRPRISAAWPSIVSQRARSPDQVMALSPVRCRLLRQELPASIYGNGGIAHIVASYPQYFIMSPS
jgi:hypothetical protein